MINEHLLSVFKFNKKQEEWEKIGSIYELR